MTTAAYIDTNLFLQFKPIAQIDWCALLATEAVVLHLTPEVVRELEQKKHADSKRLRKRAVASLEAIVAALGACATGTLRDNVELLFDPREPSDEVFQSRHLSKAISDDWLLAAMVEFAPVGATLVTDDTALGLKARGLGIAVVRPPSDLRLPAEEDEEIRKLREENKALRVQIAKRPRLELCFLNGSDFIEVEVTRPQGLDLEQLRRQVGAERLELQALARHSPKQSYGIRIRELEYSEDAVERYLKNFERYLTEYSSYEDLVRRSTAVVLKVANRGNAPATGIDIWITLPNGVEAGQGSRSREPVRPSRPRCFQTASDDRQREFEAFLATPLFPNHPGPPKWHMRDDRRLNISVDSLLHTISYELIGFWVSFPLKEDALAGFQCEYSILVADPPDEFTGSLHFIPSSSSR